MDGVVKFWVVSLTVVAILIAERLIVTRVTRTARGKEWVRRTPLLHPNAISVIRIPMGLVAVVLAMTGFWTLSILWFAFWMITDLTDGTIARDCDLMTEKGKWLDPLSDKCMYFPVLIYLSLEGPLETPLPMRWVIALLVIDTFGQFSRLLIKKKAANYFGKAKTALITILLSLVGLNGIHKLWFMSGNFLAALTFSCTLLAFMSVYCKVIPDLWYANSLTLANFLCGTAAIWQIHEGAHLQGFVLVFIGQFFDLFDGRLARKYGSTRRGPFYDDMADGTSFGVAIGYLIYSLLRDALPAPVALTAALAYVICVIYRLYRFLNPTRELPRGIFQGMPSPAGALLAGSSVLLFAPSFPLFAVALVGATSLLLISNIRYRHFGQHIWPSLPRTVKLLAFIVLLVFVNIAIVNKDYALSFCVFSFLLALTYTVAGVEYRKREPQAPSGPEGEDEAEERDEP